MRLKNFAGMPLLSAALALTCSVNSSMAASINGAVNNTVVGQFSSGEAFPLTDQSEPQMSRLVFEIGSCGPMVRSHWHDPMGLIVAAEELETNESGFVRYRYWKPNVEESAEVTRSGPSTFVIDINSAGRKEHREVEAKGDVLAGPLAVLAQSEITKLKDGATVPLRLLVPNKFAAYTFNLSRTGTAEVSKFGVAVTGDSWGARQLTKNLTMFFDANGEFQGMRGPLVPAIQSADTRHALDLDVMVNRHYTRQCSPSPVANPRELVD